MNARVLWLNRALDRAGALVPWPRHDRSCFFTLREGAGGPGVFAHKLTGAFRQQGIETTYRRLRGSSGALIFSASWGDWFHRLCRTWSVRSVLRVDGFMIPTYFDNRAQPVGYQDRRLKLDDMALNYRLQRDLAMSDHVVYQSRFSKELADHFLYNRRGDFSIIHNGIDLQRFSPGSPRSGRRRLLSAGALRDEYMLGTVLLVFLGLWKAYDLELLILGSLAPICEKQLADFSALHPDAGERVCVVGAVRNEQLPGYLHEADLLIHPRLGDACPNTVIEAMACGIPTVCGSWGGTAELIGPGSGEVVPTQEWSYGDVFVQGLTAAAAQVLNQLPAYKSRARQHAEAAFDINRVAQAYAATLGVPAQ